MYIVVMVVMDLFIIRLANSRVFSFPVKKFPGIPENFLNIPLFGQIFGRNIGRLLKNLRIPGKFPKKFREREFKISSIPGNHLPRISRLPSANPITINLKFDFML